MTIFYSGEISEKEWNKRTFDKICLKEMRKQSNNKPPKTIHKYRHQNRNITYLVSCNNLLLFITSILKKLVILASWLALSKMIYLQTAQYFGLTVWRPWEQTRWQVAATDHSVCTCRATSRRITLQWQIPSSVCLGNRILLPQQVPQILYDLTFCDMLLRQNSVTETKIFTIILQYTQSDL